MRRNAQQIENEKEESRQKQGDSGRVAYWGFKSYAEFMRYERKEIEEIEEECRAWKEKNQRT